MRGLAECIAGVGLYPLPPLHPARGILPVTHGRIWNLKRLTQNKKRSHAMKTGRIENEESKKAARLAELEGDTKESESIETAICLDIANASLAFKKDE